MKKIVLAITAALAVNLAYAQNNTDASSKKNLFATESKKFTLSTVTDWMKDKGVFQNLDVSVTAGTTGKRGDADCYVFANKVYTNWVSGTIENVETINPNSLYPHRAWDPRSAISIDSLGNGFFSQQNGGTFATVGLQYEQYRCGYSRDSHVGHRK